jgi:glycosyltransferase involved in cell wall biosynthesis
MSEVDVTVITPTFRREKLVVEAITSALDQKGVALEVIVLDDTEEGSARDAVGTIRDPRVRYVKRDVPSRGRPAVARNEAMKMARGAYLHCLDDDDALYEGALAALHEPLAKQPDLGVSFGVVVPFGDDPAAVEQERAYFERAASVARRARTPRSIARETLFGTSPFVGSACMIRRDIAIALGGFDTSMVVCEDYELFVRAIRTHGATFVDRPILRRRTGIPSISRDAGQAQADAANQAVRDSYGRAFGQAELYALRLSARASKLARRFAR